MNKERPKYSLRTGYYDKGFGVNEAEALRQDLIVDISLYGLLKRDRMESQRLRTTLWLRLERLAKIAGAKILTK